MATQTVTLACGDVIEIPGIGAKAIGAVTQIRDDRYQLRLDEKYVESIVVDVKTSVPRRDQRR